MPNYDTSGGHDGGDKNMINEIYDYFNGDYKGYSITPFDVTCDNHITTFAAEYSRVNDGQTIDVEEFKKNQTK